MNSLIGTLASDRYRIIKLLGEGADKQVYLAEDVRLYDTRRAVAVMIDSITDSEKQKSAAQAFELEAEMLTRLKHPRIPQIYDRFSEGNVHYLVMEFVEGETLQAKLDRVPGNRLPEPEALSIAIKVLAVLDYLHRRTPPVIFRDLKPDNMMLLPNGELKLIDFRYRAILPTDRQQYRSGNSRVCGTGAVPGTNRRPQRHLCIRCYLAPYADRTRSRAASF